jgi:hypothetical protein
VGGAPGVSDPQPAQIGSTLNLCSHFDIQAMKAIVFFGLVLARAIVTVQRRARTPRTRAGGAAGALSTGLVVPLPLFTTVQTTG